MGVQISATIEGEKQLSVELGVSANNIKDWRKPLSTISGGLLKTWQTNFDSRGAELGEPWKARKDNNPWPLLEKSGAMRKAFYGEQQGTDTLVLGNRATYFPFHQSNQARTKLPRRVLMKLDQARRDLVTKAFQAHIVESLRNLNK